MIGRIRRGPVGVESRIQGLPPIVGPNPRILILGSLPGRRSLDDGHYYAHPRNIFWRMLSEIHGCEVPVHVADRSIFLTTRGIALWDVVGSCERASSLDSDIVRDSVIPNPIAALLEAHPTIVRICLNGGAAATLFRTAVESTQTIPPEVERIRLPSTSPANAGISWDVKLAAWTAALR